MKYLRFEYCAKIGGETIAKIAESMRDSLTHLAIVRNFNEKAAKIDDDAIELA